jgi:hypothetical protein
MSADKAADLHRPKAGIHTNVFSSSIFQPSKLPWAKKAAKSTDKPGASHDVSKLVGTPVSEQTQGSVHTSNKASPVRCPSSTACQLHLTSHSFGQDTLGMLQGLLGF